MTDSEMLDPCVMPAGTYYVGDLCYVLKDRWDEVCSHIIKEHAVLDGMFKMKSGVTFASYTTKYGDGMYNDQRGGEYAVDAGLIGCVKVNSLAEEVDVNSTLGNIVTFDRPFICYNTREGVIHIGHLEIDTAADFYEEDEDE